MEMPFLQEIVGKEGAKSLNKAIELFPAIGSIVVPRAIVSWLTVLTKVGFEGGIPGVNNSYLSLMKNENQTLNGALTINDQLYPFENADLLHVAASLGVALGIDLEPIDDKLKNKDLTSLGKSIDLLVKSEFIKKIKLDKKEQESIQLAPANEADEPLKAATPIEPTKQPNFNSKGTKVKKDNIALGQGQKLKITKTESHKKCGECGSTLFKNESFFGCSCLSSLSKHVTTEVTASGYTLSFDNLTSDEVETIVQILKD